MRRLSRICSGLILALLLATACVLPGGADADAPELRLEAGRNHYLMAPYMQILRDPDRSLSLAQVSGPEASGRFKPVHSPRTLRLGVTDDAVWLRFRLTFGPGACACPKTTCPPAWYLELDNAHLEHISLFLPLTGGGWRELRSGQLLAAPTRPLEFRTFVLPLSGDYAEGSWIYLRLYSRNTMTTQFDLWSWQGLLHRVRSDTRFFALVLGALLAVIAYNFFVFLSLRDRAYLYYVFYVSSVFFFCLVTYGQMQIWFTLPPHFLSGLTWVVVGAVYGFGALFARNFLKTWANAPRWDLCLKGLIVASACLMIMGGLNWVHSATLTAHILAVPTPVVVLITAVLVWRRGFRPARFFVLAWSLLLVSFGMMGLKGVGLLPQAISHTYVLPSAIATEAVLLSFALADRIRLLRREKDEAHERELRYRELSVTDELTGLYNHRYLISRLASEVIHARRVNTPLTVLMLDVDDFKGYNDRHGHLAGDQVLGSLARAMELHSRGKDSVCRYGGEEFVVVMPDTSGKQGREVAERIRSSFAGLSFRPSPGMREQATVSVGVAELTDGEGPVDLLQRADRALYLAKAAGKNRVEYVPAEA